MKKELDSQKIALINKFKQIPELKDEIDMLENTQTKALENLRSMIEKNKAEADEKFS